MWVMIIVRYFFKAWANVLLAIIIITVANEREMHFTSNINLGALSIELVNISTKVLFLTLVLLAPFSVGW